MAVVLRHEVGDVLRTRRQGLGRTLRDVSTLASVSLGYLSEVERGEKEASSELLASICAALDLPMSTMLRDVSDRLESVEEATEGRLRPTRLAPAGATAAADGAVAPAVPLPVSTSGVLRRDSAA
ncbi:helix-turn-helix domain-containing protein [Agilicoccus flavus]|uniref:helix-turn-helix domain-containing protein n=1 Tax=Agilicoccus flavus TaxID=2775968 RepID=UPI001CF684ED|nr:helix-turn-helix transcriptional regulator [Agilicoccus flavus]